MLQFWCFEPSETTAKSERNNSTEVHLAPWISCQIQEQNQRSGAIFWLLGTAASHNGHCLNKLGGQELPPTRQVFIAYFFSLMTCLNMYYTLVLSCLLSFVPKRNRTQLFGFGFHLWQTERKSCLSLYRQKDPVKGGNYSEFQAANFTKRAKFIPAIGREGNLSEWPRLKDFCS